MNAVSDDRDKQLTTSFAPNVELASRWEQNASASMQQYSDAFNLMLEQAAAEGITVFRASGDYGPRELPSKQFNHVFSTSPYQVITGGTTLPYTRIIDGKIVTVNKERAWGDAYSDPKTKPSTYAGSGGGFSILNPTPRYQQGISGVNTFRAIDSLKYKDGGYLVQKIRKLFLAPDPVETSQMCLPTQIITLDTPFTFPEITCLIIPRPRKFQVIT